MSNKAGLIYDEDISSRKWAVLCTSFINIAISWGMAWGAGGVLQVAFMEEFGNSHMAGVISFVPSLIPSAMCFSGPFSSILINKFGCNTVVWIGTLLACLGCIISHFANSIWFLYGSFALIGAGLGIGFLPTYECVAEYFPKRMPTAIAIATCGTSLGTFFLPILLKELFYMYGWRGSLLITGALSLNMGLVGCVYKPLRCKPSELYCDSLDANDEYGTVKPKKKAISVHLLLDTAFVCFLFNSLICFFTIAAFSIYLPAYLISIGYSHRSAAFYLSICGIAGLPARLISGFLTQKINQPTIFYSLTVGFSALACTIAPFVQKSSFVTLYCLLFGLSLGSIGCLLPLVVAELCGRQFISEGYGYVMVFDAVGAILGPVSSGFLYDLSESFTTTLLVTGLIGLSGTLLMIYPILKTRHRGIGTIKKSHSISQMEANKVKSASDVSHSLIDKEDMK